MDDVISRKSDYHGKHSASEYQKHTHGSFYRGNNKSTSLGYNVVLPWPKGNNVLPPDESQCPSKNDNQYHICSATLSSSYLRMAGIELFLVDEYLQHVKYIF
jgi:hypothetical protein